MLNPKNIDAINVLNQLIGEKNVGFSHNELSLMLYFGDIENYNPFITSWRLFIDCSWRVNDCDKMIIGNCNEGDTIADNLKILKGLKVKDINYYKVSKDFKIFFNSGINLSIFVTSVEYAQWELERSDGYRLKLDTNTELVEYWDEPNIEK